MSDYYNVDEDQGGEYYGEDIVGGLCSTCGNAEGPYWNDKCSHYKMPLSMVYRKKKCKHYIEGICAPSNDLEYYLDDNGGWI